MYSKNIFTISIYPCLVNHIFYIQGVFTPAENVPPRGPLLSGRSMRQKRHQLAFPGDQPIFFVDSACTKDLKVEMLSQKLPIFFCSVGGVDSAWGKLWLKAISILPLD